MIKIVNMFENAKIITKQAGHIYKAVIRPHLKEN